jgi:hypothetical protein
VLIGKQLVHDSGEEQALEGDHAWDGTSAEPNHEAQCDNDLRFCSP